MCNSVLFTLVNKKFVRSFVRSLSLSPESILLLSFCGCVSVRAHSLARTRMCVSGGCGEREGPGGVGVGGMFLCACVYVCVHGRYLEGLTVGGERERERERENERTNERIFY